jgi:hypothetical protein
VYKSSQIVRKAVIPQISHVSFLFILRVMDVAILPVLTTAVARHRAAQKRPEPPASARRSSGRRRLAHPYSLRCDPLALHVPREGRHPAHVPCNQPRHALKDDLGRIRSQRLRDGFA